MELGGIVYPEIEPLNNGHKEFRILYPISHEEKEKLFGAGLDVSDSRRFSGLAENVLKSFNPRSFYKVFYHFFKDGKSKQTLLPESCTVLGGSRGMFLNLNSDGFYYVSRGIDDLSEIPVWYALISGGLKLSDELASGKV